MDFQSMPKGGYEVNRWERSGAKADDNAFAAPLPKRSLSSKLISAENGFPLAPIAAREAGDASMRSEIVQFMLNWAEQQQLRLGTFEISWDNVWKTMNLDEKKKNILLGMLLSRVSSFAERLLEGSDFEISYWRVREVRRFKLPEDQWAPVFQRLGYCAALLALKDFFYANKMDFLYSWQKVYFGHDWDFHYIVHPLSPFWQKCQKLLDPFGAKVEHEIIKIMADFMMTHLEENAAMGVDTSDFDIMIDDTLRRKGAIGKKGQE